MNRELLLQHFNRISEAPEAIPRLRRFILDLAVRGKLVEQDPGDEPAAELLKRIQAEKAQLVKEGKIKETKEIVSKVSKTPYALPATWCWVQLGITVNSHLGGGTPSKNNSIYWDGNIFWASVKDIGKGKYVDNTIDRISEAGLKDSSSNLIPPGNLIVVTRMGLGKISINRVPIAINQDLRALSLSSLASIDYYYNFFKTHGFDGSGLTVKGIRVEELLNTPFPLPPLAEQHRIVAKVDELMALCDQLEAERNQREAHRDKLVAASLNRISTTTAEEAKEAARFHLNLLPRLTTKPEHIKQLRQTILNLAVRGKLVEQDPNDEPAEELLKRIQAEKERLGVTQRRRDAKNGKNGDDSRRDVEALRESAFDLPVGWEWTQLGELIEFSDSGWSPKTENYPRSGDNWGVLKVSAVSWGRFLPEENKQLLSGVLPPQAAVVKKDDFLISRANTSELVAKSVIVEEEPTMLILSDKIVRLRLAKECNKKFLCLVNNAADYARVYYATKASGTSLSMKNVSRSVIYELPIPLPPLAEQQRIVAKVDELMGLCDQLEAQLATTTADSRRLLEAVLRDALKTHD